MSSKTPKIDWLHKTPKVTWPAERPRVYLSAEALAAIREGTSLNTDRAREAVREAADDRVFSQMYSQRYDEDTELALWMAGRQWGKSSGSFSMSSVAQPAHQPPYSMDPAWGPPRPSRKSRFDLTQHAQDLARAQKAESSLRESTRRKKEIALREEAARRQARENESMAGPDAQAEAFPPEGIFEQLDELWPPVEPPPAQARGPEVTPEAVWQWLGPVEYVGQLKGPLPTGKLSPVFSVGSDKAVGWFFEHTEVLIGINTRGLKKLELTK